jgi:Na+-translocating ferredoxin:NAD+ oxidoreductase RnfD subunit
MRFFRTPKGLLLIVLAILAAVAAPGEGGALVLRSLAAAVVPAALLDLLILRWRHGRWELPSGAILTGLIVAMLLTPHERAVVLLVTSVVAVLSKYLFRAGGANIFNPAALGLVATYYLYDTAQSWWGAVPALPLLAVGLLLIGGLFIADRVNKIPLAMAFLGVYFACFTAAAFLGRPGHVAEVFRAPDLQAALYFAFFILSDPPTSPIRPRDQLLCGAVVAAVSVVMFETVGAAYYMLAGALAGNLLEAGRRWQHRRRRMPARPLASTI